MIAFLLHPWEARAIHVALILLGQWGLARRLNRARLNWAASEKNWRN